MVYIVILIKIKKGLSLDCCLINRVLNFGIDGIVIKIVKF
jgi:hypothetical protein